MRILEAQREERFRAMASNKPGFTGNAVHKSQIDPTLAICVVDNHPRFFCETVLWAICAAEYSGFNLGVVFVGDVPQNLSKWLKSRGVTVEAAQTLIPESPHCNKLLPSKIYQGERILVTDCDVFILDDFTFMLHADQVRLPENNHCNPPFPVFEKILKRRGLAGPFEPGLSIFAGQQTRETLGTNVSCGVIWVPPGFEDVWRLWEENARWLIDHRGLMGRFKVHVDQVAFAMTAEMARPNFRHLPAQTNAILQLLPKLHHPCALHLTSGHIPKFADWFDGIGRLQIETVGEHLRDPLNRFNRAVEQARQVLSEWPETAAFAANFLNPNWRR